MLSSGIATCLALASQFAISDEQLMEQVDILVIDVLEILDEKILVLAYKHIGFTLLP